jgi:hypothetical protein
VVLKAKVDTGADTSSLDARWIRLMHREGKEWVRFVTESGGKRHEIEAPLLRRVSVKSSDGRESDRYVVSAVACLGKKATSLELTLADRRGMEYPCLLGRAFLKGRYLVDVSGKFLQEKPTCRRK